LANIVLVSAGTAAKVFADLNPGTQCITGIANNVSDAFGFVLQADETVVTDRGQAKTIYSFVDFACGMVETAFDCAQVAVPALTVFSVARDIFGGLWDLADTVSDCGDAFDIADEQELGIRIRTPHDPNGKVGSQGAGPLQFLSGRQPLAYNVYFENQASATAPAQQVFITDQLDPGAVDMGTFRFGAMSFGKTIVLPAIDRHHFTQDVDLRPVTSLIVRVEGLVNEVTGLVTWSFTSLDPNTGLLPDDPLAGFLPPNTDLVAPGGQGDVIFTVQPRLGLATGATIRNQAAIVFNTNSPILTPTCLIR